jgi:hypothetical protein
MERVLSCYVQVLRFYLVWQTMLVTQLMVARTQQIMMLVWMVEFGADGKNRTERGVS